MGQKKIQQAEMNRQDKTEENKRNRREENKASRTEETGQNRREPVDQKGRGSAVENRREQSRENIREQTELEKSKSAKVKRRERTDKVWGRDTTLQVRLAQLAPQIYYFKLKNLNCTVLISF
jgi:hypothetical protein